MSKLTLLVRTQESTKQPVNKLDSDDDWTIDGTDLLVRVRVDQCRVSHFATQEAFLQPVDQPDSVDDWTIDNSQRIVRVRVDYEVSVTHPLI